MIIIFFVVVEQGVTATDHLLPLRWTSLWSLTNTFLTELQKPKLGLGIFWLVSWFSDLGVYFMHSLQM